MIKLRKTFIAIAGILALSHCKERQAEMSDPKLIGGDAAPKGWLPSHVTFHTICGGVVISSNQILTAGHCVMQDPDAPLIFKGMSLSIRQSEAPFSYDGYPRKMGYFLMTVKNVHVHPTWVSSLKASGDPNKAADVDGTSDVAVIEVEHFDLSRVDPSIANEFAYSIRPVKLPVPKVQIDFSTLQQGSSMIITGTGCDRVGGEASLTLKRDTAVVTGVKSSALEVKSSATLCTGDSGGPAVKSTGAILKVVGINSLTSGNGQGTVARVDTIKDWLTGIIHP